jgi:hypothetical protein
MIGNLSKRGNQAAPKMKPLREILLWTCIVAGAVDVAWAQAGSPFAPAPSQVGPPVVPALPQPPLQLPDASRSKPPSSAKCRDLGGVDCKSTRQRSGQRRLRRAD